MLNADKINLGGKVIEIIDNEFCIDGISLKQIILNTILEDYKSLKKLHKEIKGENSSRLYTLLSKEFSFADQLEALLEAFEGNRSKINNILDKAREIKIRLK